MPRKKSCASNRTTKYSAIEGYYGLLAYQELQGVYHEAVDNLQGHLDNVQAQYNVGTKAKVDVLSSDVSLANAKTTAITADNNVAVAESNLNNILGLPLETKLNLADHQLPFDTYNIPSGSDGLRHEVSAGSSSGCISCSESGK